MNMFFKLVSGVALASLVTACSAKVDAPPNPFQGVNDAFKTWPEYSDAQLSGKIFGKEWKAVTAVARPINEKEMSLDFYPEVKSNACTSALTSSRPYATVIIPKAYTATEYYADMASPGTGNPLVFTEVNGAPKNLIAEKTKMRINTISAGGFNVSLYAVGVDTDGYQSEINGKIDVVDCAKAVDFSVWDELKGWYSLSTFVGNAVVSRNTILEYDSSKFYDRASGRYVKTLIFPLYYSVGASSDASYNFGPMEGLGVTTITNHNGIKTYKYSYSGPMTYKGIDITMNLEMSVATWGNNYTVNYTLEVPGHVTKTSKYYEMQK